MSVIDGAICLTTVTASLGLAWFLPRRMGLVGAVLAHLAVSVIVFSLIMYDIVRGAVADPDFIWMMGNICWTGLANLLVLPVTAFASYRHLRHLRPANNSLAREQD